MEIAYGGRWGVICNTDFAQIDAQTICRGLGFGNDGATVMSTRYYYTIVCHDGKLVIILIIRDLVY